MINKNNSQPFISNSFIDFWSILYLFVVYSFTMILDQANIIVFVTYFICALPFVFFLDKFVTICLLLSTMSYFFLGGDEGIWSLYTILAIIMLLRMFLTSKNTLSFKSVFCLVWVVVAVIISYYNSRFGYTMGMFAMIYNIVIALLIAITVKINKHTVVSFLPKITTVQIFAYVAMLAVNGHYDGYGFSVSEEINHNTFGASVAFLSIILFVKIIFFKGNSLIYILTWFMSLGLIMLSGSRNALLALVITVVIVYMVSKLHKRKVFSGGFKMLFFASLFVALGVVILPKFGIDLSRYDYVNLISTGGSNRTIIWETLTPIIVRDYKWFGYGPGHFCSEQIISIFINQDYKHTHNTFFEAWGELGVFGAIPFFLLVFFALKNGYKHIKAEDNYLLIGFLFVGVLLLSLGESFFINIELWILIGLLLSKIKTKVKDKVAIDRSNDD